MKRILLLMAATAAGVCAAAQYTLDSCQRLARENYPLIRQYGIVEQTEEYSLKNASMAYVPQLSLSGQATYQSDVVSFPDAFQEMFRMMTGEEMEGIHPDQYKFMLSLNQTIWDGGHTKSRKEMARAEKEVAVQTAETEMHALRGRVNQIYFGILMLTAQLEQNSLVQSTLENNRNTVAAYVANGTAMESDLNHIRAELMANSQRRAQVESSQKAYRMMLSLMTGVDMGEGATFAKPEVPREETMMPTGVRRPELDLFNAQTAQLEAQRRALNAAVTPKLGLFAQGWYGNPGLDMFADMMEYKWGFNGIAGVQLSWDISGFYTLRGNRRKIDLAMEQVDVQRDIFLYNNRLQQSQLSGAIERMEKVMKDDDEIIALRESIRKVSEAKLANGTMSVSDLLNDIANESQARMAKSLHELEWLKNIYEMKETVGTQD